jgi:ABC-type maltose transport system permease subunit
MKQKDIAVIIVVVFVSGVLSFFLSRLLFTSPKNRQQKVEVVNVITSDFPTPDAQYFNKDSVNPTTLIQIGDSNNPNPFNGTGQKQ